MKARGPSCSPFPASPGPGAAQGRWSFPGHPLAVTMCLGAFTCASFLPWHCHHPASAGPPASLFPCFRLSILHLSYPGPLAQLFTASQNLASVELLHLMGEEAEGTGKAPAQGHVTRKSSALAMRMASQASRPCFCHGLHTWQSIKMPPAPRIGGPMPALYRISGTSGDIGTRQQLQMLSFWVAWLKISYLEGGGSCLFSFPTVEEVELSVMGQRGGEHGSLSLPSSILLHG